MTDATKDSVLRAVAGAPAMPPPARLVGVLVVQSVDDAPLAPLETLLLARARKVHGEVVLESGRSRMLMDGCDPAVAASLALELRDEASRARIALVIGAVAHGSRAPLESLIARATALAAGGTPGVLIDDATVGYVDSHCELRRSDPDWLLLGRRSSSPSRRASSRATPSPRSPAFLLAAQLAAVLAVTFAVGYAARAWCAPAGEPVTHWTLDADGGPTDVPVELPARLSGVLGQRQVGYALHTDVALSPAERGRTLTLTLAWFYAPLALTVDGVPVIDDGDTGVSEHLYVIDAAATRRPSLRLELAAHHDFFSSLGFGVAPRLAIGRITHTRVAEVNHYGTFAALVLSALFASLNGFLFSLDRRNREPLAASILTVSAIAICLLNLVAARQLLGSFAPTVFGLTVAALLVGTLYFQQLVVGLPPPPRWLVAAWGIFAAVSLVCPLMHSLLIVEGVSLSVLGPTSSIYLFGRYVRASLVGAHRDDARLLLLFGCPLMADAVIQAIWRVSGVHPLLGIQTMLFAIVLATLGFGAVLGRRFVARQRTIEHTSAELRRLLSARSSELADALARLAHRSSAALGPGSEIDRRYRVVRTLGAGGMGTVYEVERTSDGARFALKMVRGRADEAAMARFAREAQIAAELHHPNLVPVIDIGVADDGLYLVMDLVNGGSLEAERARFGDPKWARPILAQVTRGLAAMHAHGIVHRDLKPGNVLLADGAVRIADFGLASLTASGPGDPFDATLAQGAELTRAGDLFGTPAYMAPELAAGARGAAPSSDVFSFGVMAYELVTGRSPFAEPPVKARLKGRPSAAPVMDGVSAALRPLIERCLHLDPAARPSSDELVAALSAPG